MFKPFLRSLLIPLLLLTLPVWASQVKVVEGEFIVRLEDRQTLGIENVTALIESKLGVKSVSSIKKLSMKKMYLIKVSSSLDSEAVAKKLSEADEIKYAEPNYIYEKYNLDNFDYVPQDELFSKQWAMLNVKQRLDTKYEMTAGADMKVLKAWNIIPDSIEAARDVVVAVIDTGVNDRHEDLKENLWINEGETGAWRPQNQDDVDRAPGCWDKSCNKLDDDGNGLVDDINGWNWVEFGPGNIGSAEFQDDHGHGSHCAGIIGAAHNEKGIAGINAKVQLMALKFLSKQGQGSLAGAIEAINYAKNMGADVINASWGGPQASQALFETIRSADAAGVLFVAAAGNSALNNDFFDSFPANYPVKGLVSVAATEFNDRRVYFSNYGKRSVHVSAPGHVINSTTLGKKTYQYMSGTSMAAPQVAGVAAMIIGLYPQRFERNPEAIKKYLMMTSDRSVALNWLVGSGGRVNAYNAAAGIVPAGNEAPPVLRRNWIEEEVLASSKHPYDSNTTEEFEIKKRGASWIRVKFGRYNLEEGKDQIELYDGNGNLFDTLTGFGFSATSRAIKGDTIKVVFRSDENVNHWGYEIRGIELLEGEE